MIKEFYNTILPSVRQKIGNIPIQLRSTPNHRVRLTIEAHRIDKNFLTYREAMLWLIHTYNLKHLKQTIAFSPSRPIELSKVRDGKKRELLNTAGKEIVDQIIENNFYTVEMFRDIIKEFDRLKMETGLSDEEVRLIYNDVLNILGRLLDETLDYRRHTIYKKYLDQLRIKGYRQY